MVGPFGAKGIRGSVRDELTVDSAVQLGKAVGKYFDGTLALVTDGRIISDMIKESVTAGLTASGCDVLDMGTMPLSVMQMFVRDNEHIIGGISIISFDGREDMVNVKCIFSDGVELSEGGRSKIESYYGESIKAKEAFEIGRVIEMNDVAYRPYIDAVLKTTDVQSIKRAGLSAVLDCANGPSSRTLPAILRALGVKTVTLNSDMCTDRPGKSDWMTQESINDLVELTGVNGADIGIATDINGDHVRFVTDEGECLETEQTVAILSAYAQSVRPGSVVVSTSDMSEKIDEIIEEQGGTSARSKSNILSMVEKIKETSAVFGATVSGGFIFSAHQYCCDAGMTVVKMLSAIAKNGPLSVQVSELPRFIVERRDVECPDNMKSAAIEMISELHSTTVTDSIDGVRFNMPDGIVMIRPSGTDHILRITAESDDADAAVSLAEEFAEEIENYLNA
jgi:phosphomannomutase / phosphoglucomutase